MKITYSQEAIADLIRLREFIAIKNPQAAQKVAKSIQKGISQLKTFPYLGIKVEPPLNIHAHVIDDGFKYVFGLAAFAVTRSGKTSTFVMFMRPQCNQNNNHTY